MCDWRSYVVAVISAACGNGLLPLLVCAETATPADAAAPVAVVASVTTGAPTTVPTSVADITPVTAETPATPAVSEPTAAAGSWAIVAWGAGDRLRNPFHRFAADVGINLGCTFIGMGVGVVNPVAGFFVGVTCSSGINA